MSDTKPLVHRAASASATLVHRGWQSLRQPASWRRALILFAGLMVCLYALGVLGYVLSIPDIGLRSAFTPTVNQIYREFLYDPSGQVPQQLVGYQITRIGNHEVDTWPRVLNVLIGLRTDTATPIAGREALTDRGLTHVLLGEDELVRVELRHPQTGDPVTIWLRVQRSPVANLVPSILWFFLKVGLFLVAALVLWKRPNDRSAVQFFVLSLVTFGAFMGGYHWWRIATQPVLLLVFIVCGVLLPATGLHFYFVFPRPKAFLDRRPWTTLTAIYALPVAFLILLVSGYLRVRWLYRGGTAWDGPEAALGQFCDVLYSWAGAAPGLEASLALVLAQIYVYLAVAAMLYLASVVCLLDSYRTATDATERNQVKWILTGSVVALLPMGYSLYLAFLEPNDFGGGAATWPMFLASAVMTVAFTISITRYRLMQLDQLVSWSMAYFLVSFLAGLGYYGVVFAGALVFSQWMARPSVERPSLVQALGVSTGVLVILLVLDWVRSRVKRVLNRRFFREQYQLDRTLRRMSQAIAQLVDPPTLARRLLHTAAELLAVPRGAVYLRDGDEPLYRLADAQGAPPALTELSSGCPLVEALQRRGSVMLPPWPPRNIDPAQRQLQFLGGEVAYGVGHEGQLLALLLLGPKEMGSYGVEDLNLLAAFSQITALALVSAQGHRTIEGLNEDLRDKVAKIAEQQRRIMALQTQLNRMGTGADPLATEAAADRPAVSAVAAMPSGPGGIVGSSPAVRKVLQTVRKVSAYQSTVLLRGESGTGKELLARALHESSPRAGKAFVKVHCTALAPSLLESELFGHVKGAFTSAHKDKVGRFELANGGTLFLDEIGDISLEVQTKLLRVLQEMTFERVGSSETLAVDVRIIAATHQDLEELIRAGRFREDLFYRLNVFPIQLPPLRERVEDIPELAMHFLRLYAQRCAKTVAQIDDDALAVLKGFAWPGNIRQLENVMERAVVIAEGPAVTVEELPADVLGSAAEHDANGTAEARPIAGGVRGERLERDRQERERLVRALAAAHGNKALAARALGMARSTLVSRLKKHGLS